VLLDGQPLGDCAGIGSAAKAASAWMPATNTSAGRRRRLLGDAQAVAAGPAYPQRGCQLRRAGWRRIQPHAAVLRVRAARGRAHQVVSREPHAVPVAAPLKLRRRPASTPHRRPAAPRRPH
jgi:hypothetical protein